jgi:hypothetical protein
MGNGLVGRKDEQSGVLPTPSPEEKLPVTPTEVSVDDGKGNHDTEKQRKARQLRPSAQTNTNKF